MDAQLDERLRFLVGAGSRRVGLLEGGGAVTMQANALRQLADVEDDLGEHDSAAAHRAQAERLTTP